MRGFTLNSLVLATLALALPDQAALPGGTTEDSESELLGSLHATEFAEVYIVNRGHHFIVGLSPYMVRTVGCRYIVYRNSPQWSDLERLLTAADVRIAPTTVTGEVRVGLILSDSRGTLPEIYANDLVWPSGGTNGFDQRRQVEISPRFVDALKGFVALHPALSRPDAGPVPHCPQAARADPR